jgi:hypothetical protein
MPLAEMFGEEPYSTFFVLDGESQEAARGYAGFVEKMSGCEAISPDHLFP